MIGSLSYVYAVYTITDAQSNLIENPHMLECIYNQNLKPYTQSLKGSLSSFKNIKLRSEGLYLFPKMDYITAHQN